MFLKSKNRKRKENLFLLRNYILEAHQLGKSYKQIALELGKTTSSLKKLRDMPVSSDSALYESIRNVYRRANYANLRSKGFTSRLARTHRRLQPLRKAPAVKWLNTVTESLYNRWNESYFELKFDRGNWIRNHPNFVDADGKITRFPKYVSKEEIQRRIEVAQRRGKSPEEIENY